MEGQKIDLKEGFYFIPKPTQGNSVEEEEKE